MHGRKNRTVTCPATGKTRFRDAKDARLALRHAFFARSTAAVAGATTPRNEIRSYKCEHCRGFHLTSKPYQPPVVLAMPERNLPAMPTPLTLPRPKSA